MKKIYSFVLMLSMLVFVACDQSLIQDDFEEEVALKSAHMMMNFRAHLSGDQEVPPVETMATGQAIFKLSKDGMKLHYKLIVANIDNVRMSHIHIAPMGQNGGVVVWLYPSSPPPVVIEDFDGVLAEGDIMAANLVGGLAGMQLSDLIDAFKAGNAYVNVHTVQNGGGEIRGQIMGN